MNLSYKIDSREGLMFGTFRNVLATVTGVTEMDPKDREGLDQIASDFIDVLKSEDENSNGNLEKAEWECLQDADSFKQFCESHLIDFNQLSGRINNIFHPIAFKTNPAQDTPMTEVLIFWDKNNDGIFNCDQGEKLTLLFMEGGCAMCVRGLDRTDMLPYMVKNQMKYSGKTFSELQEMAQQQPPK